MEEKEKINHKRHKLKSVARYSGLGLQLLLSIFLGYYLGNLLDEALGFSKPLFSLIFIFVFFAGSMFYLVKRLSK